jgi:hypothetical protein
MSSGRLKGIWGIVSVNNQATSADHSHLIAFGGEFLFIGLLALLAGVSDDAGKVILALLAVLWLVYITFNIDLIQRFFDAITSAAKVH